MNKSFLNEYLLTTLANLQILNQIFSVSFYQNLVIILAQLIITYILRLIFSNINPKNQLFMLKKIFSFPLDKVIDLVELISELLKIISVNKTSKFQKKDEL